MQVKIQRKGHPVETLTDPTFEQCFNTAGKMQCEFIDLTGAVSLPVTAAPTQATKTVHKSDQDNKAPVEYGFAQTAGEFGQNLPHAWTVTNGGAALYKNHTSAGVVYAPGVVFNIRPHGVADATAQMVCDGG